MSIKRPGGTLNHIIVSIKSLRSVPNLKPTKSTLFQHVSSNENGLLLGSDHHGHFEHHTTRTRRQRKEREWHFARILDGPEQTTSDHPDSHSVSITIQLLNFEPVNLV